MTTIYISPLHCENCSDELLRNLEEATGTKGFRYEAEEQKLEIPDQASRQLVSKVLRANKLVEIGTSKAQGSTRELEDSGDPSHDHNHSHNHEHNHNHSQQQRGRSVKSLLVVFAMNLLFSIVEFVAGILFNSMAIFSDAVHDLGDAVSSGMALILEKKSMKHADEIYTFGQRRFSLLGALITGLILIVGSLVALYRAIPRFIAPEPVEATGMLWLAVVAIVLNLVSALALRGRSSRSEKMLQLHMLEDILGWVAILVISVILHFQPWYFLDPLVSIGISLYILYEAIPQTIGTVKILMESVPENVNLSSIAEEILAIEGVHGFNHLHFWSMDGEENNFAVTLFTSEDALAEQERIKAELREELLPYHVSCSTIELVYDPEHLFEEGKFTKQVL